MGLEFELELGLESALDADTKRSNTFLDKKCVTTLLLGIFTRILTRVTNSRFNKFWIEVEEPFGLNFHCPQGKFYGREGEIPL